MLRVFRFIPNLEPALCLKCRSLGHLQATFRSSEPFKMQAAGDNAQAGDPGFLFGKYPIDASEVFLSTRLSYAFVNLRPVVPGHILWKPAGFATICHRWADEEVSDLWLTAKLVGKKVEKHFNASSLTFALQDGAQAGQTVPHVHVHILPRKSGDFKQNDEIYDEIDKKEHELAEKLDLDQDRKDRTPEEMAKEATALRALFC